MPEIDFQSISYYAAPKKKAEYASLDEVDPELLATFEKLGIPINEQKHLAGVAVDVVFDSVSVATTYKAHLNELGEFSYEPLQKGKQNTSQNLSESNTLRMRLADGRS